MWYSSRTFLKEYYQNNEVHKIEINDYGYAYYINDEPIRSGLVENLQDTIDMLLEDDWIEILSCHEEGEEF